MRPTCGLTRCHRHDTQSDLRAGDHGANEEEQPAAHARPPFSASMPAIGAAEQDEGAEDADEPERAGAGEDADLERHGAAGADVALLPGHALEEEAEDLPREEEAAQAEQEHQGEREPSHRPAPVATSAIIVPPSSKARAPSRRTPRGGWR